jgi:peptidoglycan/xylan/chitin deacetylase (PgdA/CDA1 family)
MLRVARRLRARTARATAIPVLTYHSVSDEPWGELDRYRIGCTEFRLQMQILATAGFAVVPLGAVADVLTGVRRLVDPDPVAVTFDDGYADFHANALPVLRVHGFPAAVFLVSDLVGDVYRWDGVERGGPPRALMSWTEVEAAAREGIEFHSHSRTHPRLSSLPPDQVEREIAGSKRVVESRLGRPVDLFCYPHGDASAAVRAQVRAAGYRAAFSTESGLSTPEQDRYYLKRVKVRPADTPLDLASRLLLGESVAEVRHRRRRRAPREVAA